MAPLPLVVALVVWAGSPQAPPSADEQRLFEEGLHAYQAGDGRAAEKAWKAGYAVAHDPAFLVRIGEAEEKAGAPAEAAETYRRYLREAPDAADRAEIEQRLARLGPGPAPPTPSAPDTNETPGELGGHPPPALPPAVAPPGSAHVAGVSPAAADAEGAGRPGEEEGSGWNRYNITAWIATAATAALLGTAGFLGASAASNKDDVNRLIIYRNEMTGAPLEYGAVAGQYQSAFNDGQSLDRAAKVTLFVAVGTAAVAATFFLLDAFRTPEAGVALGGPGAGAGSLTWRF
jgi:hypothetical protein